LSTTDYIILYTSGCGGISTDYPLIKLVAIVGVHFYQNQGRVCGSFFELNSAL